MGIEERLERIERLLIINSKKALNVSEVALMLDISEGRVRHLTSQRQMPFYKCGNKTYFNREEIEQWMLKDKILTIDELKKEAINYKQRRI